MKKTRQFGKGFTKGQLLRVSLIYAIISWLLIQICTIVFPVFNWPDWTNKLVIILLISLFPVIIYMTKGYPVSTDKKPMVVNTVLLIVLAMMLLWSYKGSTFASYMISSDRILLKNKSVAILFFDEVGDHPDTEKISRSITEELISRLSKVSGLRVIGHVGTNPLDITEIAEEFNVSAVLQGSFQLSRNRLLLHVQLVNTKSAELVWDANYDTERKDLFQTQADIVNKVVETFELGLSDEAMYEINDFPTSNTKAFDSYLKARNILEDHHLMIYDSIALLQSKKMFETAIQLDSSFAEAYAGLAKLYNRYGDMLHSQPKIVQNMDSLQIVLSEKAHKLSPNSSYVNHARGFLYANSNQPQPDSAFYYLKKARTLDPNDYLNYSTMDFTLRVHGLADLALPYSLEAIKIEPLNSRLYSNLGMSYWMLGDMENADKSYQEAYDMALQKPFHGSHLTAFWMLANKDLPVAREVIGNLQLDWWFLDAYMLILEGKPDEARLKIDPTNDISFQWWARAEIYLLLDDKEKAIESLREGIAFNYPLYIWLINSKPWKKYENDPDFQEVLEAHKQVYENKKRNYGFDFEEFMKD